MLFKILLKALALATIIQLPCTAMELPQELNQHNQNDLNSNIINKAKYSIEKYINFQQEYKAYARQECDIDIDWQHNLNEIGKNIRELKEHLKFLSTQNINASNTTNLLFQRFLRSRFELVDGYYGLRKNGEFNIKGASERMLQKKEAIVTVCNFYDELTADIFHMIPTNLLSQKTLDLISISPSLWPLLKQETEDFSDPEEAISSDLELFKNHDKITETITIKLLGYSKGEEIEIEGTPYEKFSYEKFSLGYSKDHIQEIRHPNWLVEKFNNAKNRLPLNLKHIAEVVETKIVEPVLTTEVANQDIVETKIVEPELATEVDNQEIVEPELATEADNQDKIEQEAATEVVETEIIETEIIPTRIVEEERIRPEIFRPRGIRIFHQHEQEFAQQSISGLSNSHRLTIEKLFDNGARFDVSYSDFASLWKALGGTIKNCKGSHKALKDKNGKTVTGIFAHGKNMTYTKKTIPYLRAALELIGISADSIN